MEKNSITPADPNVFETSECPPKAVQKSCLFIHILNSQDACSTFKNGDTRYLVLRAPGTTLTIAFQIGEFNATVRTLQMNNEKDSSDPESD